MRRLITSLALLFGALAALIAVPNPAHAVLGVSATSSSPNTATVTVTDGPARRSDTVELRNSSNQRVAWLYLNGSQSRPRSGIRNATVNFQNVAAGTYTARLISNLREVARSSAFVVSNPTTGNRGIVYLTFDDGPEELGSPALRAILDRYGVKGTFFVMGAKVVLRPTEIATIVNTGHQVGNHTYTHPDLRTLTDAQIIQELNSTSTAIANATGRSAPRCMRPPYGHVDIGDAQQGMGYNPNVRSVINSLGLTIEMWTHDTRDWDTTNVGVTQIVNTLNSMPTTAGSISNVLMHDGITNTRTALEQWLPTAVGRYDFRIVPSC